MKGPLVLLFAIFVVLGCKTNRSVSLSNDDPPDFVIAFGSCNKTGKKNKLWDDILAIAPDLWIWGGDNIYADTENIAEMAAMYDAQDSIEGYKKLKESTTVIGTWDDHDYGLNDGGMEFGPKRESQRVFLDFMDVPEDSPRRGYEGIYTSHRYDFPKGSVKVLILDTRYFRTPLTRDTETDKRFKPNEYGMGTLLGRQQWAWLETELGNSTADFNIIVSSIQVLSDQHGFECWGNFPHEVDHLKKIIVGSGAKGVVLLSGDRHISEFSRADIKGLAYPLVDFTSSGLTHSYSEFDQELNPYRSGRVISTVSFGVLDFDIEKRTILFKIVGDKGRVLARLAQTY